MPTDIHRHVNTQLVSLLMCIQIDHRSALLILSELDQELRIVGFLRFIPRRNVLYDVCRNAYSY